MIAMANCFLPFVWNGIGHDWLHLFTASEEANKAEVEDVVTEMKRMLQGSNYLRTGKGMSVDPRGSRPHKGSRKLFDYRPEGN